MFKRFDESDCFKDGWYPIMAGSKIIYIHAMIELSFGILILSLFGIAILFKGIPALLLCFCPDCLVAWKKKYHASEFAEDKYDRLD